MFSTTSNGGLSLDCAYPVIKETIPKSRLGYATNNVYEGFPPLMEDTRSVVGSWQSDSVVNNSIKKEYNIQNNNDYRRFLQKNAKDVMQWQFRESSNDCGYYQRPVEPNNGTPFEYKSYLDSEKPVGYEDSDLKEIYLTREQLQAKKTSVEYS
jgi:hypothetical protein